MSTYIRNTTILGTRCILSFNNFELMTVCRNIIIHIYIATMVAGMCCISLIGTSRIGYNRNVVVFACRNNRCFNGLSANATFLMLNTGSFLCSFGINNPIGQSMTESLLYCFTATITYNRVRTGCFNFICRNDNSCINFNLISRNNHKVSSIAIIRYATIFAVFNDYCISR